MKYKIIPLLIALIPHVAFAESIPPPKELNYRNMRCVRIETEAPAPTSPQNPTAYKCNAATSSKATSYYNDLGIVRFASGKIVELTTNKDGSPSKLDGKDSLSIIEEPKELNSKLSVINANTGGASCCAIAFILNRNSETITQFAVAEGDDVRTEIIGEEIALSGIAPTEYSQSDPSQILSKGGPFKIRLDATGVALR